MKLDIGASLEAAGIVSMTITFGTIISSLLSEKLIKRFGTGKITFASVLSTAVALLGFSVSGSIIWLIAFAVPLGLGAGSIDVGLNNFVALHYRAHHMSWLHCFWGVGATLGPVIMSMCIKSNNGWRSGYLIISMIQFVMAAILLPSIPVWSRIPENTDPEEPMENTFLDESNGNGAFRVKGLILSLTVFLFYCGIETTTGLWGSSYLVNVKHMDPADAARWISLYYAGITLGRFVVGFITMKLSNRDLIRWGQVIILTGIALLLLPLPLQVSNSGFVLIGLGCAPIFPSMIHETPNRFGRSNSQKVIGLQMAFAYIGSAGLPPLTGFIAARMTIKIFPYFLAAFALIMLISTELINSIMQKRRILKAS